MRSALYFLTALLATGSAMASAIPSPEDAGGEDLQVVTLTEADLEPIPDGDLDKRGWLDCKPVVCKDKKRKDCYRVNTKAGTCVNLVSSNGKAFVGASSSGSCMCTAYSRKGCPWIRGDDYGWTGAANFGFKAKSIKCAIY